MRFLTLKPVAATGYTSIDSGIYELLIEVAAIGQLKKYQASKKQTIG